MHGLDLAVMHSLIYSYPPAGMGGGSIGGERSSNPDVAKEKVPFEPPCNPMHPCFDLTLSLLEDCLPPSPNLPLVAHSCSEPDMRALTCHLSPIGGWARYA